MEKLTTLIKSIEIKGLFEMFDYKIEYPTSENVLIITGPNGFGKTQVLNIIFNLFNRRFTFFRKLIFNQIAICLTDEIKIAIEKDNSKKATQLKNTELQADKDIVDKDIRDDIEDTTDFRVYFYEHNTLIEEVPFSGGISENFMQYIEALLPVGRLGESKWVDHRSGQILSTDEVLDLYGNRLPPEIRKNTFRITTKRANEILDSINVHIIREQRLFKKVQNQERNSRKEKEQTIMTETIQTYADELKELILENFQQSYKTSQSLDSTYPDRLIKETKILSKEEYDERFEKLAQKQEKLTQNGLYESKQKVLQYSKSDAKALLVYLDDLEKKLSVFDELLEKLELFTNILNERRFTYKSISIDREKGFFFTTNKGKILDLNELSSGEQHEVVLLYELIFKTKSGILVLIDEPEISLHVTWQKEFLDDLLRIVKIQDFQVLIATHSPAIINDRWDLVYNLEKQEVE